VFRAAGRWQLVIALGIVLLAVLIWPTLYRYDRMYDRPVRINRITGTAQVLSASGWHTLGPVRITATHRIERVWTERDKAPDTFDTLDQEALEAVVQGLESMPESP
jgi:hypothetical protein